MHHVIAVRTDRAVRSPTDLDRKMGVSCGVWLCSLRSPQQGSWPRSQSVGFIEEKPVLSCPYSRSVSARSIKSGKFRYKVEV